MVQLFTSAQVKALLDAPITPYPYDSLRIVEQEQIYPFYPIVEVIKISAESTNIDVQKTQNDVTFEIRFHVKYTRPEDVEEADTQTTEDIIRSTLEAADLPPTSKIFFEGKSWNRQYINADIRGSISTMRFTFRDVTSTTGDGLVGADMILELNSQATPTTIQVLNFTDTSGTTITTHYNDVGKAFYDPRYFIDGDFFIAYESTSAVEAVVKAIAGSGIENNGRLTRFGIPINLTFLLGQTTKSVDYSGVERATTRLAVTGTWI
ncbi:MAG TPA: hypothetical protein ENI23_09060 [bacterium]|nr:hypothetical protein [bacterium]